MALLKLFSSGCARNSRTVPHTLAEPVLTMAFPEMMDWEFSETIKMDDDTAMSIDFATLDDKWAYYVTVDSKVAQGAWSVKFSMCGIKTYMLQNHTTIKGMWNKTPTWIDPDTVTPAISGYQRGRNVALPGLLPDGWVFIEMRVGMKLFIPGVNNKFVDYHPCVGFFVPLTSSSAQIAKLYDIIYDLSLFNYLTVENESAIILKALDVEQIESMNFSRLCPYNWVLNNGVPMLSKNGVKENYNFEFHTEQNATSPIYRIIHCWIYDTLPFSIHKDGVEIVEQIKPEINSATLNLTLTEEERKFGIYTVFAPTPYGRIERTNETPNYYFEVDNTGWYLNIEQSMDKIVIPSMKLPYMSDAWKAYQFREMEYDRAELARSNQYAKNKFYADVVKGFANGAMAGGFAGTHSKKFGAQMGVASFAGTTIGAAVDRFNEIGNNDWAQRNKEDAMRNELDSYYNSGYGYKIIYSNDFNISIAMPIDDMENEVKISGYSCTGNLVAELAPGFLQGVPEPNDTIKGTIRNVISYELQTGVWII